ncbi:hypothetical protein [Veillonella sp.]|uniref:hypothetical protein n=1 Tax=Veillonella sp. TaxID=1926307 RepID=UPI0025FD0E5B|nr:hypothetical protein [Veillonella sp.]
MNIEIIKDRFNKNNIIVKSPYNEDFIEKCHKLNGKFDYNYKGWVFPEALIEDIKQALFEVYDWSETEEKIEIEYKAIDFIAKENEIRIGNKLVGIRTERDYRVTLYDTVVEYGQLPKTGGSGKYPSIFENTNDVGKDTILKSKITKKLYDKLSDEDKEKIKIMK